MSKWDIRQKVWDYIEAKNLANFPRPVHNRIPNFKVSKLISTVMSATWYFIMTKYWSLCCIHNFGMPYRCSYLNDCEFSSYLWSHCLESSPRESVALLCEGVRRKRLEGIFSCCLTLNDSSLCLLQGAERACAHLSTLEIFHRTREVKVDPDKPLEGARLAVLQVTISPAYCTKETSSISEGLVKIMSFCQRHTAVFFVFEWFGHVTLLQLKPAWFQEPTPMCSPCKQHNVPFYVMSPV